MIVRKTEYVQCLHCPVQSYHFLPQANKVFYHKLILIIFSSSCKSNEETQLSLCSGLVLNPLNNLLDAKFVNEKISYAAIILIVSQ